jgi:hypothetical protein
VFAWTLFAIVPIAFLFLVVWGSPEGEKSTRGDLCRIVMGNWATNLAQFYKTKGRFPTEAEGLEAVLNSESRERLIDPWGRKFLYYSDGDHFVLISAGFDGAFGTDDDLAEFSK